MAVVKNQRIDLRAHDWVARTPVPEIVSHLREILTPRLAALIGTCARPKPPASGLNTCASHPLRPEPSYGQPPASKIVETTFDDPAGQSRNPRHAPNSGPAGLRPGRCRASDEDELRGALQAARRFVVP